MRHSDTFCEPCREAMVLALSKKVVPFDFHVEERDDGFALNFTHIVPGPVRARWFVGNRQVSQGADRIFVSRDQIGRLGTAVSEWCWPIVSKLSASIIQRSIHLSFIY